MTLNRLWNLYTLKELYILFTHFWDDDAQEDWHRIHTVKWIYTPLNGNHTKRLLSRANYIHIFVECIFMLQLLNHNVISEKAFAQFYSSIESKMHQTAPKLILLRDEHDVLMCLCSLFYYTLYSHTFEWNVCVSVCVLKTRVAIQCEIYL